MAERRFGVRLRDERGLSVLETVIAGGLFMCLLVAVLSMLDSGTRAERTQQASHDALLELRDAMTQVSTDVRQAVRVTPDSTASRLTIETLRAGAERWLVFELVNDQLLIRACAALPCTASATSALANAVTGSFCYDPPGCISSSPSVAVSSIRISLAVQPEGSSATDMELATDVELRNI